MRVSTWQLRLTLVAWIGLASALSARAYGQDPQTGPAAQAPLIGTPITRSAPGTIPPGFPTMSHDDLAKLAAGPVPAHVLYYFLFENLAVANQIADEQDTKGKDGNYYRTIDQKAAGLTESEGATMNEIAVDCKQQLDALDVRIKAAIDAHRAQSATPPKNPLTNEEFNQFGRARDAIVDEHIVRLKSRLGDASFDKLDAYVKAKYHPVVAEPGRVKPHIPAAAPNSGGVQ